MRNLEEEHSLCPLLLPSHLRSECQLQPLFQCLFQLPVGELQLLLLAGLHLLLPVAVGHLLHLLQCHLEELPPSHLQHQATPLLQDMELCLLQLVSLLQYPLTLQVLPLFLFQLQHMQNQALVMATIIMDITTFSSQSMLERLIMTQSTSMTTQLI